MDSIQSFLKGHFTSIFRLPLAFSLGILLRPGRGHRHMHFAGYCLVQLVSLLAIIISIVLLMVYINGQAETLLNTLGKRLGLAWSMFHHHSWFLLWFLIKDASKDEFL